MNVKAALAPDDAQVLERAGATESEIERIMWKNCADVFNIPYDDPTTISTAA